MLTSLVVPIVVCLAIVLDAQAFAGEATRLVRSYRVGEPIRYTMRGVNEDHRRTIRYQAVAEGTVKRDQSWPAYEELRWTTLFLDGKDVPLTSESQGFREYLSLMPVFRLRVPDLSKVQPMLIGPITDLLTFYADLQLAMRQGGLLRNGDHVYVPHGTPNSWADGTYTVFGQDSIDFDLTLMARDERKGVATLVVRHVPPSRPQIAFPAAWMRDAFGGRAANWAQVTRGQAGRFEAAVGQETFEASLEIALSSGRILSAKLDNPVDVSERECSSAALTACGAPYHYLIHRQVRLTAPSR